MGELAFVGLGLDGTRDLSAKAREVVGAADEVVAEFYTSHLVGATLADLQQALGRPVRVLAREQVEAAQEILRAAKTRRVAFLCAGDPLTATTHQDLRLAALEQGIPVQVVHGVSIQTAAAGAAGLHSYKFGRTTTLVFPEPRFRPTSPYDVVAENKARGLHTLVLLDLRAHENRYMRAHEGVQLLLEFEQELGKGALRPEDLVVALARVGTPIEEVVAGPARDVAQADLGPPLHCIIVPGALHFSEEAMLGRHARPSQG